MQFERGTSMTGFNFDMSAFDKGLEALEKRTRTAARDAITDVTYDLLKESVNLAPLDKGVLRQAWAEFDSTATAETGEVYFSAVEKEGKDRVNYALIVHEMGEAFKNPTTPGTQPKFLERPLKENADDYVRRMAEIMRKEM